MTRSGAELDAERVLALFQELSDLLDARGLQAQLFVVGGAAMALAYDGDRVTRDVDALLIPAAQVRQIAEEIGVAHGLEPDWLNDAAKGFLPGTDEHSRTVFESESLLVQVPSPEYLLAMKLHAARDERDLDDAVTLFNTLGYTSAQECIDLLATTYPPGQLLPRHRYVAQEVADRAEALHARNTSPRLPLSQSAPDAEPSKPVRNRKQEPNANDPWRSRQRPGGSGPGRSL